MEREQAKLFFGSLGALVTIIFHISSSVPFIYLLRGKIDLHKTPIVSVLISYCNCFFWNTYADMICCPPMKYCYLISGLVCFILIVIYLAFEIAQFFLDAVINIFIILSGTYTGYLFFNFAEDEEGNINIDELAGKLCLGVSVLMNLASIRTIHKVCKTKNVKYIPIINSIISLLSNTCWAFVGIIIQDFYIVGGHGFGFLMSISLVVTFFIYQNNLTNEIGFKGISSSQDNHFAIEESTKIDFVTEVEEKK